MQFVYVLRSMKNGRFYVGCTNNLGRRLKEHNNGKSRYTRQTAPFQLIYHEVYENLSAARRREMALKGGKGREWLKNKFGRAVA